jgi:hypothetical protein
MNKILSFLLLFYCTSEAYSQELAPASEILNSETDTLNISDGVSSEDLRVNALNVSMMVNDYIRKEIPYVNYVRDIKDADVYIISTNQRTGSGGYEQTFFFTGQNLCSGMSDTLSFTTGPDETQEERRIKEVRTLKMGLMRYVAKTPLADYINITSNAPISETVSSDPWNSWVYKASFNGRLDKSQSTNSSDLTGDISATRVSQNWKIDLRGRYNQTHSSFDIAGAKVISTTTSKSFNGLAVKSISDHWSTGGSFFAGSSTFSNEEMTFKFLPGIEYDLFPYSESTRRQLRLLYSFGYTHFNYIDSTIYNKITEGHLLHSLQAAYEVVQKWGSIELNLDYSNFLYNWSKNNVSFRGTMNLRIFKGMSVFVSGGASLIHDQLSLVKQGASPEEILLKQKELASSFNYFTRFGLTFTFGSIYNNVVNPRFGSPREFDFRF